MSIAEISGRKLYYECHGDLEPGGPAPLLLVMGMAGTCKGWLPLQVPFFVETRPVILFDHRGVGESEDTGQDFTTYDLASDALALLDFLDVDVADVLGPFMGGRTAQ